MRSIPKAPIGTHPRLLFTDADRPELMAKVANDSFTKLAFTAVSNSITGSLLRPGHLLNSVYGQLSKGQFADTNNFTRSLSTVGDWSFGWYDWGYAKTGVGGYFNLTGNDRSIYSALAGYSYMIYLRQTVNVTEAQLAARATATAARQHHSLYPSFLATAGKATPKYFDVELAFAYDLLYNYMNETERNNTRNFISYLTTGKSLSYTMCNANDQFTTPHGTLQYLSLMTMALSIEGETGYDNSSMVNVCLCAKDSLKTWVIRKDGSYHQNMGWTYYIDSGFLSFYVASRANLCVRK